MTKPCCFYILYTLLLVEMLCSMHNKRAGIGRLMSDIHFIWRPANWPDRPIRTLRAFHGFDEYLVGFYGFNTHRQSRWLAHRTFILCGRQPYGLNDGPFLLSDLYGGVPCRLFTLHHSFDDSSYFCFVRASRILCPIHISFNDMKQLVA